MNFNLVLSSDEGATPPFNVRALKLNQLYTLKTTEQNPQSIAVFQTDTSNPYRFATLRYVKHPAANDALALEYHPDFPSLVEYLQAQGVRSELLEKIGATPEMLKSERLALRTLRDIMNKGRNQP